MHKAVFFDRDGVLIATHVRNGKPYAIRNVSDLAILPAALELITMFRQNNYKIVVVTNQPDVGHGYVEQSVVEEMHRVLSMQLPIDVIKVCYHKQDAGCACRKPGVAMFTSAATELDIDLTRSIMIGDRSSDIIAGNKVGCFTIFIDCGYNEPLELQADLVVSSLRDVLTVKGIYEHSKHQ